MFNRFKNVIYGSSNTTSDDTSLPRLVHDADVIRIRKALTRSCSFREDLIGESGRINRNINGVHQTKRQALSKISGDSNESQYGYDGSNSKKAKFRYSRPEFLQLKTDDEILVSADHQIRPIILPRDVSRLPWNSGYAECINAGKSLRNEDQAASYQDILIKQTSSLFYNYANDQRSESDKNPTELPWIYFGIFDGHAGSAVAVAAANHLHKIISEKLGQVADALFALEFKRSQDEEEEEDEDEEEDCAKFLDCSGRDENRNYETSSSIDEKNSDETVKGDTDGEDQPTEKKDSKPVDANADDEDVKPDPKPSESCKSDESDAANPQESSFNSILDNVDWNFIDMIENCSRQQITVDSLITGALESAFWEMDALIAKDKQDYKMAGGCTAVISLFILGKLYVCNAGDSRAIVYKNDQVIEMSNDFTPISERKRILRLGLQRPEFLGNEFTHLEFLRRPTRRDLGKEMLYRDAFMTGWSMKTITHDDLKFPLVWGEGKRSRVLATIGVTRGFGDHELKAQYGSVPIKPFLTPEPEVKILALEGDDEITSEDVLIMGSDGLWDVTSNEEACKVVKSSFMSYQFNKEETCLKYRYITAAQDLVIHSRGHTTNWNNIWRTNDDKLASLDDIAVFVIPLKQYRDDYLEWKDKLSSKSQRHQQHRAASS